MGARSQRAHDLLAEAEDAPVAADRNEAHFARLARLEADRRARGNVETHAPGRGAVEAQGRIGFEEVVVRPDLDGTVAVLATSSVIWAAPTLISISPLAGMTSPGIMRKRILS